MAEANQQTGGQSSSQGGSQAQQGGTSPPANTSSAQPNPNQSNNGAAATASPAAPPEWLKFVPERFRKDNSADFESWSKDYNENVAFKAAEDSRRLTLPQSPDAYKVELPAGFKPPEGIKFEFKSDDPLLAQARTTAHQLGISQEGFSKLLGLYAGAQVATQQQIETARNAEVAKLGATGAARVKAVTTWAKAMLGDAAGAQFAARMFTASDIENAEKLITRFSSQGGGSFRQTGRDGEPSGRLPDGAEGEKIWNSWTYSQKKEYTEKFQQGANGAAN